MKKLLASLLLIVGCSSPSPPKIIAYRDVDKVFLGDARNIMFIQGGEVMELSGTIKIKYDLGKEEKIYLEQKIVYSWGSTERELIIHLHDSDEISPGTKDKGKFGKMKYEEL